MYLRRFNAQGVRNLSACNIELDPNINIVFGKNGAGKSSILESIGLITSGRSFRTARLEQVVSKSEAHFTLFGGLSDNQRLGIEFKKNGKEKRVRVNGERLQSLAALSRIYPTQFLSPESYHLIDSGPSERRKFIDWCLFHVEHQYHTVWKNYSNVLKQRNALLKKAHKSVNLYEVIDGWNSQLVLYGNEITRYRQDLVDNVSVKLCDILRNLSLNFCEGVKLHFYPGFKGEFADRLKESLDYDQKIKTTSIGPHKGDLRITVDGVPVKEFLSRGQKKVLINALFLAQTAVLKELTEKDSLFVIDDFTSELDNNNQVALIDALLEQKNVQIVLSCLQLESLKWLKTRYNMAQLFHVEHGKIRAFDSSDM